MKNILVFAALTGLALAALLNHSWPSLAAATGIGVSFIFTRNARISTRIQLIFVAALGGGLITEIIRTIYLSGQQSSAQVGLYKQALIVSLGTVVFVLGAMLIEFLLLKLTKKQEQGD